MVVLGESRGPKMANSRKRRGRKIHFHPGYRA